MSGWIKTWSAQRVNRGLWVDIYKEAQHAGEVPPGWKSSEATRKPIPKVTRARLTLEDWQKIYNATPEKHFIRNAMLLAIVTGQRRDDICHMRFQMCGTNTCILPREKLECVWRYR